MSVSVAEYLGQRTDSSIPISPVANKSGAICPFMNSVCSKVVKSNPPVCSVRNTSDNKLWLVCENRLCAASNKKTGKGRKKSPIPLSSYQNKILMQVAREVFIPTITVDNVLVKRQSRMIVTIDSTYSADYVMRTKDEKFAEDNGPTKFVLEIQGGGETTNTGKITRHIRNVWEKSIPNLNNTLADVIKGPAPLVTNAWRRQQEQFLVKGSIAMQTSRGCAIVFCVGTLLYDYLKLRVESFGLKDLKKFNWTLALIAFKEIEILPGTSIPTGPIELEIDRDKTMFTSYQSFVRALIDPANPSPETFNGEFEALDGTSHIII